MKFLPVIFLQSLTYTLGLHTENSTLTETQNMEEENLDTGMRQQREIVDIYKQCLSNKECPENDEKLDKDYLISAHWGSTTSSCMNKPDRNFEYSPSEKTKQDCLHKYRTFQFTDPTTHWPTISPPQTATYRIVNPNPYCKHYQAAEKNKKKAHPKDIPLDVPIIIHSRTGV